MASAELLMTPGPVILTQEVVQALAQPAVFHHEPGYNETLDRCVALLAELFDTDGLAVVLPGSGRLGLEAALTSVIRPGDRTLHLVNGFFATWLVEMARRAGAEVTVLESPLEEPLSPDMLRQALSAARRRNRPYTLVAAVHCETSTGQLNPVGDLGAICREFDALFLADTVSSLGCAPLSMTHDRIDLSASASQKGLCAPMGLSAAAAGPRARAVMAEQGRKPAQSYALDLARWERFFASPLPRPYPVAPSTHLVYALYTSLRQMQAEGFSRRIARHDRIAAATRAGLTALSLKQFPQAPSPSVSAFRTPPGISSQQIVQGMLQKHKIRIAGGMGQVADAIIRVSHIGLQAGPDLQLRTLRALADVLNGLGHRCEAGAGEQAFQETYQAGLNKGES